MENECSEKVVTLPNNRVSTLEPRLTILRLLCSASDFAVERTSVLRQKARIDYVLNDLIVLKDTLAAHSLKGDSFLMARIL